MFGHCASMFHIVPLNNIDKGLCEVKIYHFSCTELPNIDWKELSAFNLHICDIHTSVFSVSVWFHIVPM